MTYNITLGEGGVQEKLALVSQGVEGIDRLHIWFKSITHPLKHTSPHKLVYQLRLPRIWVRNPRNTTPATCQKPNPKITRLPSVWAGIHEVPRLPRVWHQNPRSTTPATLMGPESNNYQACPATGTGTGNLT